MDAADVDLGVERMAGRIGHVGDPDRQVGGERRNRLVVLVADEQEDDAVDLLDRVGVNPDLSAGGCLTRLLAPHRKDECAKKSRRRGRCPSRTSYSEPEREPRENPCGES